MNLEEFRSLAKELSEENKATQKALADIKAMLSQFLDDKKKSKSYIERGYRT